METPTPIRHKLPALWDALGVANVDEAAARITQIIERCGLETRLPRPWHRRRGTWSCCWDNVRWDRFDVLPRPVERGDLREMLQEILRLGRIPDQGRPTRRAFGR